MAQLDEGSLGCYEHRRTAFSLTELAVVAVIIFLCAMLVGPSLEAARGRSRHAVCLTNLRKIGEATRVYTEQDDAGLALPTHHRYYEVSSGAPPFIGAYEWGGKSGIGRNPYPYGGWTYGTLAELGPDTRPLNKILYPSGFHTAVPGSAGFQIRRIHEQLELPYFRCPSDDGPPASGHCKDWVNNPSRSSYDHFGNSYAANLFMVASASGDGCWYSNSPFLRPLSRVPAPSRTLSYEENIGRFAFHTHKRRCDLSAGSSPGPTKALRGWHGKNWTYTRAFVDGHVATQAIWVEGTLDPNGYAYHYNVEQLEWYPPAAQDCSGVDAGLSQDELRHYYRCVIVRGDGWQKDTLPGPLLNTDIQVGYYEVRGMEGCSGAAIWPL